MIYSRNGIRSFCFCVLAALLQQLWASGQATVPSASLPSQTLPAHVVTPDQQKQFDSVYHQSINFWGKVTNQNGSPVAGATIKYWILDEASDPENLPEHTTTTDAQGLFSIVGQTGATLTIDVSKDGYYGVSSENAGGALGSRGKFNYGARGLHDRALPTEGNPAVFVIQKAGSPAQHVTSLEKRSAIPNNGTSTVIYLDPLNKTSTSKGDLQISATVDAPSSTSMTPRKAQYTWNATISVPGGGLIPVSNQLVFEAPNTGYQSSVQFGFQAGDAHWRSSVEKRYYVKLGNNHFCRISVTFYANKKSLVVVRGFYNQDVGDPNLEMSASSNLLQ